MAVSRQEIKDALSQMPVMELVELISELESAWGVSAAAPVAVAAAPAGGAAGAQPHPSRAGRAVAQHHEQPKGTRPVEAGGVGCGRYLVHY